MATDSLEAARSRIAAMRIAPCSGIESSRAAAAEFEALLTAAECWSIAEQLREPEGAEVILLCDNPDFNGQPNNAIEICDSWTQWTNKRFTGDTMLDCLRAALRARTEDEAVRKQERKDEGR